MRTLAEVQDAQQARQMNELYQRDGYAWAIEQADALRRRDFARVDWENVIEEIEDVGQRRRDSLSSQYARAIERLLKIEYRRDKENLYVTGWVNSVSSARREMNNILLDNPGLKGARDDVFAKAWLKGREATVDAFVIYDTSEGTQDAAKLHRKQKRLQRTWSEALPSSCPYTRVQVENPDWMPDRLAERPQNRERQEQ